MPKRPLLVRTWNVFHGNAAVPERRAYLEEMVRLVSADGPDVVCLQEVPVWALRRLGGWSGMTVVGVVAARPRLGSAELGRVLTELHHGLLRSAFSGQANAILTAPPLRVRDERTFRISRRGERRICQAVRLGDVGLVGNFHATGGAVAEEQFLRAAAFLDALAAPGEPVILCGDANVEPACGTIFGELRSWGFSEPAPGIDQILVRGLPSTPPAVWPDERRRVGGRVLSDHAPVELRVG
jgi:endonuclease/exonuclease/phosphatase family metal-dependent hydrolase